MTRRSNQHLKSRGGRQARDEAACRFRSPGRAKHAWMSADAQELIANAPSEKRRHGIATRFIQPATALHADVRVLISRVDQHVGIKDQQLLLFHHTVELVAVGDIYQVPTAVPRWQRRQGIRFFTARDGICQNVAKASLHKSGHRRAAPGRLFTQALHYGIVAVEGCLHMDNHIMQARRHLVPRHVLPWRWCSRAGGAGSTRMIRRNMLCARVRLPLQSRGHCHGAPGACARERSGSRLDAKPLASAFPMSGSVGRRSRYSPICFPLS